MGKRSLNKVLIPNRGEIALRIKRACDKLDVKSVLAISEADTDTYFARQFDEVEILGPAAPGDSYLNIDRILEAAKRSGADALHPGYGFLSENADLARRAGEAGLNYIGSTPESIEILGSKVEARKRVSAFGVPCTTGVADALSDEELIAAARDIGYPVMLKSDSGGGGRGMRVAQSEEELSGFLGNAREEARKNFGSALVYVEKYVERPRHVEVQIFGDAHGNILHFGTRDCSTQRRHQKLVEEAPAPGLSPNLRRDIHEAAVKAARSVNYQNAGTVEFMVAGNNFYFLEINTRIQVEHPITEIITGIDLVELQLRVARGEKLPLSQRQVNFDGHAIEFRIYAEDPSYKFMPVAGKIFSMPSSFDGLDYVRLDRGFESGDVLSTHYDAMIAKVIVQGDNREQALQRSEEVLKSFRIEGPPTTIPFHRWLLKLSPFRKGPLDVGYVERAFSQESLTALKASEILDPSHKEPESGAEHVETLRYGSKRFKTDYLINIYHEAGGTFLIEPGNPQGGGTAKRRYCRRSNGRQAALTSLIEEVLEKVVPEEVFA